MSSYQDNGIIYLSGGGGSKESRPIDTDFINHLPANARILYLPFAAAPKQNGYDESINWLTETLENVGQDHHFSIDVPRDDKEIRSISLDDYDAVYIGGGNTYRLLDIVKGCKLDDKIIKFYKNGGVIYGGSAGAIILGKTIKTVAEENLFDSKNQNGTDLVNGLSIRCHFVEDDKDAIRKVAIKINTNILCLSERSGVMLTGGVLRDIGYEPYLLIEH